jgi:hypothetical protein
MSIDIRDRLPPYDVAKIALGHFPSKAVGYPKAGGVDVQAVIAPSFPVEPQHLVAKALTQQIARSIIRSRNQEMHGSVSP